LLTLCSWVLLPLLLAVSPGAARSGVNDPFPARSALAPTGSEFLRLTQGLGGAAREQAILRELLSGNMPSHLRALVPVQLATGSYSATVYVLPDYLAIGSDDDFVVIPMTPRTAMRIANAFDFTLPTRKLVDAIYDQSTVRLTPAPLRPGPQMASNAYYREHDCLIKEQAPGGPAAPPLMIAGHKKDVVLTPRLQAQPGRVAIYGWHRQDGRPIQPLSLVHGIEYVDYSHGVRLVSRTAVLDGEPVDILDLYTNPELSVLLSDEGALSAQGYL
jgi:hypothetical protein